MQNLLRTGGSKVITLFANKTTSLISNTPTVSILRCSQSAPFPPQCCQAKDLVFEHIYINRRHLASACLRRWTPASRSLSETI